MNNKKVKCSYADKYKGIKEPTCGCLTCENIFLKKQNEQKDIKLNEFYRIEKNQQDEINNLKHIKFKNFNDEEYWIFSDDGEDYINSLVCPVTMSAEKLRELIEARDELKHIKETEKFQIEGIRNAARMVCPVSGYVISSKESRNQLEELATFIEKLHE